MSQPRSEIDYGILIRRSLFFLTLVSLTLCNLFLLFRGLTSPHAMDQAQIAREMARGNGASTQFIRPADYYLAAKAAKDDAVPFEGFKDTYHAPLNPWITSIVFKLVGADNPDAYPMGPAEGIFPLDRVVATLSTIFFLLAIGVNYVLIARIFDPKIAGACAVILLFSSVLWGFALSGLPQMLMLLLFSTALLFVYLAIEKHHEGKSALLHALLAGLFFSLLALTHWVAIWIALGYLLFAAIVFRPRGVVGASLFGILLLAGIFVIVRNLQITGEPFGAAFITRANGLGMGAEMKDMRELGPYVPDYNFKGLIQRVFQLVLAQFGQIVPLLAGILVAPFFFLSLLHPFKSPNIGMLRWALLSMWLLAVLGLAFFGISDEPLDPNQIHLLFAPLMTAYGVALVSILWTRLDFVGYIPMLRNAHLFAICIICAAPLLLKLPRAVKIGMQHNENPLYANWPPYYAPAMHDSQEGMRAWVDKDEIVVSDQPWAVAWYADRMSVWLPSSVEDFRALEDAAEENDTPFAGILISPVSHGEHTVRETVQLYDDFAPLVLNSAVIEVTQPRSILIHDKASHLKTLTADYPHLEPLLNPQIIFYSADPVR